MIEIDKSKQEYAQNATLSIVELLNNQVNLYGIKGTIERYCIMRDALWVIAEKLSDSDASDITDAIAVIECILKDLRVRQIKMQRNYPLLRYISVLHCQYHTYLL